MPKAKKNSKKNSWDHKINNKRFIFFLVFALIGSYLAAVTFAAPKPAIPATIILNEADPYLGSTVTFTVTYPRLKGNITPRIAVKCFQDVNGDGAIDTTSLRSPDLVYAEAGEYTHTFWLGGGGSDWRTSGGPATCNAELFYLDYSGNSSQHYYSLKTTSDFQVGDKR